MAGMTPDRPASKRRIRSPLHEMDGDELDDDELIRTPKSDSESNVPSLTAIAAIVRQELQTAIGPSDSKLTIMDATLSERMGKVEDAVGDQDVRITRLEELMTKGVPESSSMSDFAGKIAELQTQIDALKGFPEQSQKEMSKTMVVGGLQACDSLCAATKWLHDKLESLNLGKPNETYMKGPLFNGVLFAKYPSSYARDMAIATLRSANMKHGSNQVWATQDLPIPTRARKMFLLGLRWQLGDWGFVKREIDIDENYTRMTIAGHTVVQISSCNGDLKIAWENGWADWDEFQSCAQLEEIMDKAKAVLKKQGKGGGKSKDRGAAPSH